MGRSLAAVRQLVRGKKRCSWCGGHHPVRTFADVSLLSTCYMTTGRLPIKWINEPGPYMHCHICPGSLLDCRGASLLQEHDWWRPRSFAQHHQPICRVFDPLGQSNENCLRSAPQFVRCGDAFQDEVTDGIMDRWARSIWWNHRVFPLALLAMYWLPGLLNCLRTLGFSKAFDLLDPLVFWVALLHLETESKPGSASTSLIALCACRPTLAPTFAALTLEGQCRSPRIWKADNEW